MDLYRSGTCTRKLPTISKSYSTHTNYKQTNLEIVHSSSYMHTQKIDDSNSFYVVGSSPPPSFAEKLREASHQTCRAYTTTLYGLSQRDSPGICRESVEAMSVYEQVEGEHRKTQRERERERKNVCVNEGTEWDWRGENVGRS